MRRLDTPRRLTALALALALWSTLGGPSIVADESGTPRTLGSAEQRNGAPAPAPPPPFFADQQIEPTFFPQPGKRPGHYTLQEWREAIDQIWGDGEPTASKLALFDKVWRVIDLKFACFRDLELDWDEVRERYRPEIANGVSRGRFAAILNHLAWSLQESHTAINDVAVNQQTYPSPGVPLMYVGSWGWDNHFGACVTPSDRETLLVYDVGPQHPLGLEPGDVIIGYDGRRWQDLFPRLLEAELPLSASWWVSSPGTIEHALRAAVGRNWHLYETVELRK